MTSMVRLSVVLAVHNEERQLANCLEAVKSLADEFVVVDGESSDATVQIATSFGAKIIHTTNKVNFHINKQMAIDAAAYELIFQLDADEVADPDLVAFIMDLKTQAIPTSDNAVVAWTIARKNYFLSRWLSKGGQYPDRVIRLFYAGKARLPQKNVHEQLEVSGQVAIGRGHLLHYANPTFRDYMVKFNRYTTAEAVRLKENAVLVPSVFQSFVAKPFSTLFSLYLRHRGYVDGMPGFLFALLSALHHPFVWLKYKELTYEHTD